MSRDPSIQKELCSLCSQINKLNERINKLENKLNERKKEKIIREIQGPPGERGLCGPQGERGIHPIIQGTNSQYITTYHFTNTYGQVGNVLSLNNEGISTLLFHLRPNVSISYYSLIYSNTNRSENDIDSIYVYLYDITNQNYNNSTSEPILLDKIQTTTGNIPKVSNFIEGEKIIIPSSKEERQFIVRFIDKGSENGSNNITLLSLTFGFSEE